MCVGGSCVTVCVNAAACAAIMRFVTGVVMALLLLLLLYVVCCGVARVWTEAVGGREA